MGERKGKNLRKREKIHLTFEMWIFRNGEPVRDTDRMIFCSDDFNLGATLTCLGSFCVNTCIMSRKSLYRIKRTGNKP